MLLLDQTRVRPGRSRWCGVVGGTTKQLDRSIGVELTNLPPANALQVIACKLPSLDPPPAKGKLLGGPIDQSGWMTRTHSNGCYTMFRRNESEIATALFTETVCGVSIRNPRPKRPANQERRALLVSSVHGDGAGEPSGACRGHVKQRP